ncbi:MAG: bifunctional oligoribonuclease/PAP phosphatase NrnA [Sweet potato little leaf phytoplasma]|nr:bifunctional oligoribonuclease/PAP phosphatase NrnA [Sweet potato little leaf phytoplasma]
MNQKVVEMNTKMISINHLILHNINEFDIITIFGHKNPDGDCYGSQLGLKDIIQQSFPNKQVYALGENNPIFSFLGIMDEINDDIIAKSLAIVVDCGNTNVISDFRYKIAKKIIRIDHHLIGDVYGDEKNSWIEPNFSSCSEMIYTFKEINNLKLSIKGALPIYIGMVTDTGHFRFDRVNHKTLKIVSDLLSYGFDAFQIDTKITVQPINILRFKGYVCSNFVAEDGLIYVKITNEIIEKFKLRFEDINSVVNIFHNIQDHPVWLFIIENKVNNYWKISIRSIGPKINHIANKFNGGGHFRACGMNVYNQQEIDQVIQLAKNSIKDYEHQRNLNIKLSNQ